MIPADFMTENYDLMELMAIYKREGKNSWEKNNIESFSCFWFSPPTHRQSGPNSFTFSDMRFPFIAASFLLLLCSALSGIEIRVATYNVRLGLGPAEITDPNNSNLMRPTPTAAVLKRIDADVIGLQEIDTNDLARGYVEEFADFLGLDHIFIPETALDTTSRVVILSRYPFLPASRTSILSPPGANDVTRAAAAVIVDVPNTTKDPTIVNAHLKCCFEPDDPFRRSVEMARIRQYLESRSLSGGDNVIVMGDFNLIGQNDLRFSSLPPGLPPSYRLGNDIRFDVEYFIDPTRYFSGLGITNPGSRQQDGVSRETFRGSSSSILDYLLFSSAISARTPKTEIYNSNLEATFAGLPKSGDPLPAATSADASDHYPVFGDLRLDDGLGLAFSATQTTLNEGAPAVTLTVTLDEPAPNPVTVTFNNEAPSELLLALNTVIIPAGQTTGSTTATALFDRISDGTQTVAVFASAPGYEAEFLEFSIRDDDPQAYWLTSFTSPVVEDFRNFGGTQTPSAWTDGGVTWRGNDDGSLGSFGARSYQESLGVFSASPVSFQTTLRNDTGETIPALAISYNAIHRRRSTGGSPDRLRFSLTRNGIISDLPELTFAPSIDGPDGRLLPPESTTLSTLLRDLNLAPGEQADLRVELIPGSPPGNISNEVFLNEFHYDNVGGDTGEFVEVFVGEAFPGLPSQIAIQLYNGNNGRAYGSLQNLQSFVETRPLAPGGPRLFHKQISGIQNGSPDGIALVVNGVVKEFISYEGAFTAIDGVAAGIVSNPIGVSQVNTPVGRNSIARIGSGSAAEDFAWQLQIGLHTPGAINTGQTVTASPQPQGMAIDNLVYTPLADSDGDSLPDIEEAELGTDPDHPDSDRDGQDDRFEVLLAGTDPLSPSSFFRPEFEIGPEGPELSFPGLAERIYQVEVSQNMIEWNPLPAQAGRGEVISQPLPQAEQLFFRVRIFLP